MSLAVRVDVVAIDELDQPHVGLACRRYLQVRLSRSDWMNTGASAVVPARRRRSIASSRVFQRQAEVAGGTSGAWFRDRRRCVRPFSLDLRLASAITSRERRDLELAVEAW